MSSAETDLYQELVLEHKLSPRNFGHLSAPTHQARGINPSCGDDLSVELNGADGRLADIRFQGQGCAICMASASMMTKAVKGQDIAIAQASQQRFRSVLTGKEDTEGAQLGKLISLTGVSRYPSRIKCALLGWHALMHAVARHAESSTAPSRPRENNDDETPSRRRADQPAGGGRTHS